MKKKLILILGLLILGSTSAGPAQTIPADVEPTPSDSLEVEKLKLTIEQLKLENQRLELQIKTLQLGTPTANVAPGPSPTPSKGQSGQKFLAADMAAEAERLAKEQAANGHTVVLDFTNGEVWYEGMRNNLNDFQQLCKDQNWDARPNFVKYDINGDSLNRYQHDNMILERYMMQSRGVFTLTAPSKPEDFNFTTPEGVNSDSTFEDFRNHFESRYYMFDKQRREQGFRVLRFKHSNGFLGFDDVLEFWFDAKGKFVKLKWGVLDKK